MTGNTTESHLNTLIIEIQQFGFALINTLEGTEKLHVGEYLIKGINGEFYPVASERFNKIYEKF